MEQFGRLCNSKGRKPVVKKVDDKIYIQNCPYSPLDPHSNHEDIFCGMIYTWSQEGISDNDGYWVLNIRTTYD